MLSHHVVVENPYEKEKNIMLMEGSECISCHSSSIRIVKEPIHGTFKNHYYCVDCGTEWYGNAYDSHTYETVSDKKDTSFCADKNNILSNIIFEILCLKFCPFVAFIIATVSLLMKKQGNNSENEKILKCFDLICAILGFILFIF